MDLMMTYIQDEQSSKKEGLPMGFLVTTRALA